jgi:predicted transcriptional regulator
MSNSVKEFQALKNTLQKLSQQRDREAGRLDELMERLKTELGANSLSEANEILNELEQEQEEAKEAFETAMAEFSDKWGDVINDLD